MDQEKKLDDIEISNSTNKKTIYSIKEMIKIKKEITKTEHNVPKFMGKE